MNLADFQSAAMLKHENLADSIKSQSVALTEVINKQKAQSSENIANISATSSAMRNIILPLIQSLVNGIVSMTAKLSSSKNDNTNLAFKK